VSSEALSASLELQKRTPNEPLGVLMVRQGLLEEAQLTEALGEFFRMM